jgi:hypothetical protein
MRGNLRRFSSVSPLKAKIKGFRENFLKAFNCPFSKDKLCLNKYKLVLKPMSKMI